MKFFKFIFFTITITLFLTNNFIANEALSSERLEYHESKKDCDVRGNEDCIIGACVNGVVIDIYPFYKFEGFPSARSCNRLSFNGYQCSYVKTEAFDSVTHTIGFECKIDTGGSWARCKVTYIRPSGGINGRFKFSIRTRCVSKRL